MEPFIGQIVLFGGNYAPRGWALCDGQSLDINSHSALFAVLNFTYGGDQKTGKFNLPDLRSRIPIHAGAGPNLQPKTLGEQGGTSSTSLNVAHLPSHNHGFSFSKFSIQVGTISTIAMQDDPTDNMLGGTSEPLYAKTTPTTALHAESLKVSIDGQIFYAGNGTAMPNEQPYLATNYIIATQGIFPSRP